ncbi:LppU/SCO3897 family protein [Paractinoplanes brasiliensis]|uniref:Uncharacterized protein n=1 Tax=Paractinoplanes brasiliensis TaxID=52695 RepID=A0A4R6JSJ1_9ACTN|nr:hypothetical protein [Actinoplanes brasiliensis]TDO39560.1 hypothetical protein C8E87_3251 [Actinoplanes brasiliensis]GID29101.1 hypothetical protein Abr02nite_40840 [Actinoplanes brasiliensis]
MSQNGPYSGPPWSHGSSDEPYAEPADPWGDHGAAQVPEQSSWGGHPPSIQQQPVSFHSAPMSPVSGGGPSWDRNPPQPKRNTPIIALVATLGVLIVIGLGTTAWLLNQRNNQQQKQAAPTASVTEPVAGPAPQGSEDARFNVKKGDCVVNEGTDEEPNMRATACVTGTYEVLARFTGKATGEKDAERKCAKVTGYTKWFFYDSALDDLDFVLCLKEHQTNG